jgi:hypothetical protein
MRWLFLLLFGWIFWVEIVVVRLCAVFLAPSTHLDPFQKGSIIVGQRFYFFRKLKIQTEVDVSLIAHAEIIQSQELLFSIRLAIDRNTLPLHNDRHHQFSISVSIMQNQLCVDTSLLTLGHVIDLFNWNQIAEKGTVFCAKLHIAGYRLKAVVTALYTMGRSGLRNRTLTLQLRFRHSVEQFGKEIVVPTSFLQSSKFKYSFKTAISPIAFLPFEHAHRQIHQKLRLVTFEILSLIATLPRT